MRTSEFTYLLEHPDTINREQVDDFKSILEEFPYFQPARALYLKGLKINDSFLYNQELKTAAAYTTDRSVLFDFITSEEFAQNEISDLIKYNLEHLKEIELQDFEELSSDLPAGSHDRSFENIEEKSSISMASEEIRSDESVSVQGVETEKAEERLRIGMPLEFDKSELHSFSEWLKITSFKPIIREDEDQRDVQDDLKTKRRITQEKTIDKFIETNPVMPALRSDIQQADLAKAQMSQPDSLMTETLARIYLEQKNYEKAKQAYRVLSLKYPEKSGFFADQIQAIEELENNKPNS
ncbi:MAG: hypothetical protein KJO00_10710 [Bacteroidia bacterium]|nr:hypothetical protein [Bacteroidia bacterium]NNK71610.1 hypothetical protein [Flavobacteriaceae bacterium]